MLLFFLFRFGYLGFNFYIISHVNEHYLSPPLTPLCYLIQWSPDKSSVFGSAAEDGLLNIWDYDKVCTFLQIHIEIIFLSL